MLCEGGFGVVYFATLARARAGMSNDPGRFAAAEANFLEAHGIFVTARGESHAETRKCIEYLVEF